MAGQNLLWRSLAALALAIALMLPSVALAGGVAVTLDSPPADVQPDVAFTFGFTIRSAHEDRTLMGGLKPIIIAGNPATDEQVKATGAPEGSLGHYVATITFPSAGAWQWQVQPFGDDPGYKLTLQGPVEVRAPGQQQAAAPPAAAPVTQGVEALDSLFNLRDLTVTAGTQILWTNTSKLPHTVTAKDGMFASGNMDTGTTYAFTFGEPGTYAYYCEYHGTAIGSGMAGIITVLAATSPPTAGMPATGGARSTAFVAVVVALIAGALGLALWRRGARAIR
jgi:plastocyanin